MTFLAPTFVTDFEGAVYFKADANLLWNLSMSRKGGAIFVLPYQLITCDTGGLDWPGDWAPRSLPRSWSSVIQGTRRGPSSDLFDTFFCLHLCARPRSLIIVRRRASNKLRLIQVDATLNASSVFVGIQVKMSSQKTVPNSVKFLIGGTSGFVFFPFFPLHLFWTYSYNICERMELWHALFFFNYLFYNYQCFFFAITEEFEGRMVIILQITRELFLIDYFSWCYLLIYNLLFVIKTKKVNV